MNSGTKRISCQRCRLRKVRCNRVHPCSTCTVSGVNCVFRDEDTKRRPVSREYVVALEKKLVSYEQLLTRLRNASETERDEILKKKMHEHDLSSIQPDIVANSEGDFDYTGSSRRSTMYMLSESSGSSSFYGPTSVYPKEIMSSKDYHALPHESYRALERWHDARLHESLNFNHEHFVAGLISFFKYQHSQCLFIEKGAFRRDYGALDYDSKYCSYPLLYAACSLGARSGDPEAAKQAEFFSHVSYEMIRKRSLEVPDLTTVQTLLCLAFSELSKGRNPKGWMLSGMAFRMAQDLGLHQDPKFVASDDAAVQGSQDHEVQRRVYWGCYTIDKIISLYFGRPMFLHEEDAAVDPVDTSIFIDEGDNTTGILPSEQSTELNELLPVLLLQISDLSKIIESVLSQVFSTKMIKKSRKDLVMTRLAGLEELNLRLFQWHSALPEAITWNRWTQRTDGLHDNILILYVLYHSTLISLNRHFIRPTPGFARKSQSKEICMGSVDNILAILRQFRAHCALSKGPVIFIYGTIMAGTALAFTRESQPADHGQKTEIDYQATSIIKMLEEVSETYPPARGASARLKACFEIPSRQEHQPSSISPDPLGNHHSHTSRNTLDALLDDHDPLSFWGSMDSGIANLMPMDWPDVDDGKLFALDDEDTPTI